MGGSVKFIFPDCGKIEKSLLELCDANGIKEFLFIITDKPDKPRHIIRFYGVSKPNRMSIKVVIEKKKRR